MPLARRFWLIAAAVLVSASAAQGQATKLLPNDTEMVVTINIQQVLNSEALKAQEAKVITDLIKGKITQGLEDKGTDKYLKQAGFDIYKDLSSITFALPGGRSFEESFVVVNGKFDAEKIEAAFKDAAKDTEAKFEVTEIAKTRAFEIQGKAEKKMYVGILDAKTMILCGSKTDFAEAVDRFKGTKKAAFKADVVKGLLETISPKQSISMVATSNMMSRVADNAPQAGAQAKAAVAAIQQVDGASIAITLQKDLEILIGVNAKDKETASKYSAIADAFLKAAREKVAEKAKENEKDEQVKLTLDILRTIQATTRGSNIIIQGRISYENLGAIIKLLPLNPPQ